MADEKFEKFYVRFCGVKEVLRDIKNKIATKNDIHQLMMAIDSYSKRSDTYFHEMVMLSHKVDRHERCFQLFAEKLGLKLEYYKTWCKEASFFMRFFAKIKDKRNVILLGDNPEDTGMVDGFEYDNLLKIGFFNDEKMENLASFKKAFDVVILNDSSMEFVNNLLQEIIK